MYLNNNAANSTNYKTIEQSAARRNTFDDKNNEAEEMKTPPSVKCSAAAASCVLQEIATVLLGNAVSFQDPNSNLTNSVVQLPRDQLPSNFVATIVAAGHQMLLFRNEKARIQRQKFEDSECVLAVARRLMRLHKKLGAKFVELSRHSFRSLAKWDRTKEVAALFDSFVECLTNNAFNDNSQSVLDLLMPLLENPPSIADIAVKKYEHDGWQSPDEIEFIAGLEKIGCVTIFGYESNYNFHRRFIAVPDLVKCGFVDASSLSGDGPIGELKSHLVNNITGSSGAGKTQNAILASASWDPMNLGVTILVDMTDISGGLGNAKTRNAFSAVRLLNAVAAALGSPDHVRFSTDDESIADDLEKFLADNFKKSFASLNIGKKFFGKVVIVVDEIGRYHQFHRGLCCSWKTIRKFLAQELHLDSEDQLFLVTAGTGSENMIELVALESLEETYAMLRANTPRFFANCLQGLAENGETDSIRLWANTILNCLFCRRLSADGNSELVLKQEGLDRRTSYFARMATYNCRIAALAINTIISTATSTSALKQSESDILREFSSKCAEWATTIAKTFRSLNKLGSYSADEAHEAIAKAIRIAMWKQKSLSSDGETETLCVNLGLLEEAARVVCEFDAEKHELIKRVNKKKYLVIAKGTSRYRIPETYVAMFLSYTSSSCESTPDQTKDKNDIIIDSRGAFELATADHHALVASLRFSKIKMSGRVSFTPLSEPSKSLAKTELIRRNGCSFSFIERFFCDEHKHEDDNEFDWLSPSHPEESVWDKWRDIVENGGCVVIVNGKSAPFADVIVLSPGRVFLTKCNNNNNNNGTPLDANEEFRKMLESTEKMPNGSTNEELREKLAACCENDDEVDFAATIVTLSAKADCDSTKLPNRDVNGVTWSFAENKIVVAFEQGTPQNASFLYPVLSTRIQDSDSNAEKE